MPKAFPNSTKNSHVLRSRLYGICDGKKSLLTIPSGTESDKLDELMIINFSVLETRRRNAIFLLAELYLNCFLYL